MAVLESSKTDRRETVMKMVRNLMLEARLNVLYFGTKAEAFESRSRALKIATALAATGAVAAFISNFLGPVWQGALAATSAALAAIGPFVQWDEKASVARREEFGYVRVFDGTRQLLSMLLLSELTEEHEGRLSGLRDLRTSLTITASPGDGTVIERLWKQVEGEFPSSQAWE